jgi:hypothetical protein
VNPKMNKLSKETLIQQFTHTLRSSLITQKAGIKRAIRTQDYSDLSQLVYRLDGIIKALGNSK